MRRVHLRLLSAFMVCCAQWMKSSPIGLRWAHACRTNRGANLYHFGVSKSRQNSAPTWKWTSTTQTVCEPSLPKRYFKAVNAKTLDRPVINVKFLGGEDGKAAPDPILHQIRARLFARWVIQTDQCRRRSERLQRKRYSFSAERSVRLRPHFPSVPQRRKSP